MPELGDEPLARPKKKEKVRSVWISFVGRILAQIIGAIASVVLGLGGSRGRTGHAPHARHRDVAARQFFAEPC